MSNEREGLAQKLLRAWRNRTQAVPRRMKLVETLPMGGKRYLALVECDGRSFLVGGKMDAVLSIAALQAPEVAQQHESVATMSEIRMDAAPEHAEPVEVRAVTKKALSPLVAWLSANTKIHIVRNRKAPSQRELAAKPDTLRDNNWKSFDEALAACNVRSEAVMPEVPNATPQSSEGSLERELVAWAAERSRELWPQEQRRWTA